MSTTDNTSPTSTPGDVAADALASAPLQIAIDCVDPHAMADFWAAALGYEVEHDESFIRRMMDEGHATDDDVAHHNGVLVWRTASAMRDPNGRSRFYFQAVPEPKAVKNRMQLDIHVDPAARDAAEARLIGLGATRLYEGHQGPQTWVTMADIEGNEFCLS